MRQKLTWTTIGIACVLVCPGRWSPPVHGQQPDPERPARAGESAEELAQSALDKIDAGEYDRAGAMLGRARRLNPKLAKLDLVEGLLLLDWREQRNPAEAEQRLRAYCNSTEGRADYRGPAALARLYLDSRSYREAVRELEKTTKIAPLEENGKPVRAQAMIDLATAQLGLNRKKEAMDSAKEAVSKAPDQADIQLGFAKIAADAQDQVTAEAAAKRAVELLMNKIKRQPFDKRLHDSLKQCYQLQLTVKKTALQKNPDDGAIIAAVAAIWVDQAELDRRLGLLLAREIVLQAIQKDPKQYDWQVMAARIEIDLGATEEAKRRLDEIHQAVPDHAGVAKLLESLPSSTTEEQQPK
jgi:tetratricopeptide (TPR) repeat protein